MRSIGKRYIIEFILPNYLYYSKSKLDKMLALDLMANAISYVMVD